MPVLRSRLLACRLLLLLVAAVVAPPLEAATFAGRAVRDVLADLQRDGLTLVYNDQLVPGSLRVMVEPAARAGLPLLNEILSPHGLTTRAVGPATYAIVAGAAPAKPAPPRPRPAVGLDEVVVTASQYTLAGTGPEVTTFLSQSELRSLPKLADEPLRAVHRLPGAASNGLSGLAHIRGGEENETRIVLDGMPLTEPFHLKNFFSPVSVLDGEIVGGLEVYAGGFPVDYGDSMSAVLDTSSVDPAGGAEYALGLSLFHLSGFAGDTFAGDRGRWVASARRSNLSQVLNFTENDLGEPRYVDAFLKAELDVSDRTTIAGHALLAEDRVELNDKDETEFARTEDRNVYLWTTVEHRWSDELAARALAGWTTVNKDREGTVEAPGESGEVRDLRDSHQGLLRLEVEQGDEDLRWRFGVDAAWLWAEYDYESRLTTADDYPFPGDAATDVQRALAPEPDGRATGAFIAARWRLTDALTGEVGLRWDDQTYDDVDGGTQLAPRLNLLYDLSEDTQVRASWGRFHQAQGINELQVEDGIDTFFPAERADHLILSVEHALSPGVSARLEAYYKHYEALKPRFENLFDPLVLLPELQTDRVEVAPTSGLVRGVELVLRDRVAEPWGWWLGYTWSIAEETIDGDHVPRSWDQRHAFSGGVTWTEGAWDVALAGTWHTGWPSTPATLGPGPDPTVVIGPRNSTRYEDFRSVDLRVGYTFALADSELLAFLEVVNLFARKNPCCVEYTVVDDGNGGVDLQRDFDPWPRFVPNLGVLWRF